MADNSNSSSLSPEQQQQRVATAKRLLLELQSQRGTLDTEAQAIISELQAPQTLTLRDGTIQDLPCMGLKTPLVDLEGYPRADIDVYRARSLRGRLAQLETDRRSLTEKIDVYLQQISLLMQTPERRAQEDAELAARRAPKPKPTFDAATGRWTVTTWDGTKLMGDADYHHITVTKSNGASPDLQRDDSPAASDGLLPSAAASPSLASQFAHVPPFARIDSVADQSPAQATGLQVGDLVVSFDNILLDSNSASPSSLLPLVGERVGRAAADNTSLVVVVKRQQTWHELRLQPQPWAGRGLLGCHLVPL
jgi:26S proteasome non-ATPase regulatory subunit 9